MKKAFLILTVVLAVSGAVWFNAGASSMDTLLADVHSDFFLDARAGQHIPAQFFNSAEALQELPCEASEVPGTISCQFPKEYAGQQVPVELTKDNVMHVSLVNVPAQ